MRATSVFPALAKPSAPAGQENAVFAADLPCRTADPDLFFAESPADLERAKLLCEPCPVKAKCLALALDRQEPWGVWGGEIFDQGIVIARKRPRGRPRKVAA